MASDRLQCSTGGSASGSHAPPVAANGRTSRSLNGFAAADQTLFEQLVRGKVLLSGLRNKDLRQLLGHTTTPISPALTRLRVHGLLEKIAQTDKCDVTDRGRRVILAGLELKTLVLIPAACGTPGRCSNSFPNRSRLHP